MILDLKNIVFLILWITLFLGCGSDNSIQNKSDALSSEQNNTEISSSSSFVGTLTRDMLSNVNDGAISTLNFPECSTSLRVKHMFHSQQDNLMLVLDCITPRMLIITSINQDGTLNKIFGSEGKTYITSDVLFRFYDVQSTEDDHLIFSALHHTNVPTNGRFNNIALKYNLNGQIDTSFGTDGATELVSYFPDSVAIHIDSFGRILYGHDGSPTLIRLTSDGRIDKTFGDNGSIALKNSRISTITTDNENRIILIAYTYEKGSSYSSVYRLLEGGTFDKSFGDNGSILINNIFPKVRKISNVNIITDNFNNLTISGYSAIMRLNSNGEPDYSFKNNTNLSSSKVMGSDMIIDDTEIYTLRSEYKYFHLGATVSRFSSDGHIDTSFGNNGSMHQALGFSAKGGAKMIKHNEKIITASSAYKKIFFAAFPLLNTTPKESTPILINNFDLTPKSFEYEKILDFGTSTSIISGVNIIRDKQVFASLLSLKDLDSKSYNIDFNTDAVLLVSSSVTCKAPSIESIINIDGTAVVTLKNNESGCDFSGSSHLLMFYHIKNISRRNVEIINI